MKIMNVLIQILTAMRLSFGQDRTYDRFQRQAIIQLVLSGRHTISRKIVYSNREQRDWSADYRLYSSSEWSVRRCQEVIIDKVLSHLDPNDPIVVNVDDTHIHKTGKCIPGTSYIRDPLGPKFHTNLIWGQRFLNFTITIPHHKKQNLPARSIPIRFEHTPSVKKPGKRATDDDWKQYAEEKKKLNMSIAALTHINYIREDCDSLGYQNKRMILVGDGSFCNRVMFREPIDNVDVIARCRKDAKLCFQAEDDTRRFYSSEKFTPTQMLKNDDITWQEKVFFFKGKWRSVRFKEVANVLWQGGAKRRPLRLIVVEGLRFMKSNGKEYKKNPVQFLTTDFVTSAEDLLQMCFDRWEIEVNHRELKTVLGVGQAQVWNPQSVAKHPQMVSIAYSSILLATLEAVGPKRDENQYLLPPKWYKSRARPSLEDMIRKLHEELINSPEIQALLRIEVAWKKACQSTAA